MADEATTETTQQPAAGTTTAAAETQATADVGKTAAAAETGKTATETTEAADWRAPITDADARKLAESSTDLNHFAKRTLEMRQKLSVAIIPPGKDAKPEDVAEYRKKTGVPDSPDAYVFEDPKDYVPTEIDKALRGVMAKAFHDNNVPGETAKLLSNAYRDMVRGQVEALKAADEKFASDSDAALKREWGPDYPANKEHARRAAVDILGADYKAASEIEDKTGRFVLDNPVFMKMLAKIGRESGEGGLSGVVTEGERTTLQGQIDDVRKEIAEYQAKGDNKRANDLYVREQSLIARLNGAKPVVGSQGRAA